MKLFYLFFISVILFVQEEGANMKVEILLNSEQETLKLASEFVLHLEKNSVITVNGNLGAGKTVFAKGLGKGLKIQGEITSPTFNILKCYFDGSMPFYHIDAYRLEDSTNCDIGLEEVIDGDGICYIEWPKFIDYLICESLNIKIEILSENKRQFIFESESEKYQKALEFLRSYNHEL